MIEELRQLLDIYDKIFLVCDAKNKLRVKRFLLSEALLHSQKQILFLTAGDFENQNHCKVVSEEMIAYMEMLYRTYEFSDRFQLLSSETCIGDLWNYVDTGILTEDEAFEALLYG